MKQICPVVFKNAVAILVVSFAVVLSVYGQQPTSSPSAEPARPKGETVGTKTTDANSAATAKNPDVAKPDPDPFNLYVFPTHRERFDRYVKDTVGPLRVARSVVAAGIDQWRDTPEEWGQGMEGYGKRFASHMGRNAVQQTVTYGLDEAFGLDSGFQRSGREGFGARVKHAFLETITSRTKSGKRVLSAPRLAGVYTGAVVAAETWYPERYSYKDGLRMGTSSLLTGFGINLVREFFINW